MDGTKSGWKGLTEEQCDWLVDEFMAQSERVTAECVHDDDAFNEEMTIIAAALISTIIKIFDVNYQEADLAAAAVIARCNQRLSGAVSH